MLLTEERICDGSVVAHQIAEMSRATTICKTLPVTNSNASTTYSLVTIESDFQLVITYLKRQHESIVVRNYGNWQKHYLILAYRNTIISQRNVEKCLGSVI